MRTRRNWNVNWNMLPYGTTSFWFLNWMGMGLNSVQSSDVNNPFLATPEMPIRIRTYESQREYAPNAPEMPRTETLPSQWYGYSSWKFSSLRDPLKWILSRKEYSGFAVALRYYFFLIFDCSEEITSSPLQTSMQQCPYGFQNRVLPAFLLPDDVPLQWTKKTPSRRESEGWRYAGVMNGSQRMRLSSFRGV